MHQDQHAATGSAFCTGCGTPAGSGRFCGSCGAPLAQQQATTQVLPVQRDAEAGFLGDAPAEDDVLVAEHEDVSVPRRSPMRARVLAVVGLVTALLAAGAVVGVRYVGGAGERRAVEDSAAAFNGVLRSFSAAGTTEEVSLAAGKAEEGAERLAGVLRRLAGEDGQQARLIRSHVEAEAALLTALAALGPVDERPLETWGASHAALEEAMQGESRTRERLARRDADAVAGLEEPEAVMTGVTTTVGGVLAEDAVRQASALVARLDAAALTADLRKVGDAAGAEAPAVADATAALGGTDQAEVLSGYGALVTALAPLSRIDGESTGAWKSVRQAVSTAVGAVVAAGGGSTSGLRTELPAALASVDGVLKTADAKMADWKAAHAAAAEARKDDSAELASYVDFFRTQTKGYEQLREDLSAFFDRVEDPNAGVTYYEAFGFLSQATQDRQSVRDVLNGTSVPDEVRAEHDAVVAVVDRAIGAVQAAYDGASQASDCIEYCYYRDTPGWEVFQTQSEKISKDYAAALRAWDAASAAAKTTIAKRPLPAKPEV